MRSFGTSSRYSPPKEWRVAGREVPERHLEGAADVGVQVMHRAREAIGRQPLGQGIGFEKGAIHLLGLGAKDAVKLDSARRHESSPFCVAGWGSSGSIPFSLSSRSSPRHFDIDRPWRREQRIPAHLACTKAKRRMARQEATAASANAQAAMDATVRTWFHHAHSRRYAGQ